MVEFIESLNAYLWGVPILLLIVGAGIYLSVKSRFAQIRLLPIAIRSFFSSLWHKDDGTGIPPFRALCTALAATVGTGNLAGVAGAIAIGGPGAVFWLWISGLLGMVIKFAEVIIAFLYRKRDQRGEWIAGPMLNIQNGMPQKYCCLAYLFAFFGVIASFGIGNATQVNAIVGSIERIAGATGNQLLLQQKLVLGVLLGLFALNAFWGGIQKISGYAQILVPVAAGSYILLALGILVVNFQRIPSVLLTIVQGAFCPKAVTGGMVGTFFQVMRIGVSRGVFTNEAGMGTASIAHAAAEVSDPVTQGLLGIVEVFLDTIVICTLTAFAILCSGVMVPFGKDVGIQLTLDAFSSVYGDWVLVPLTIITALLALATILGWGLYGIRCAQFLFGDSVSHGFAILQGITVMVGVLAETSVVWTLSEMVNGLMAIPNLIAVIYLTPQFIEIVKAYRSK